MGKSRKARENASKQLEDPQYANQYQALQENRTPEERQQAEGKQNGVPHKRNLLNHLFVQPQPTNSNPTNPNNMGFHSTLSHPTHPRSTTLHPVGHQSTGRRSANPQSTINHISDHPSANQQPLVHQQPRGPHKPLETKHPTFNPQSNHTLPRYHPSRVVNEYKDPVKNPGLRDPAYYGRHQAPLPDQSGHNGGPTQKGPIYPSQAYFAPHNQRGYSNHPTHRGNVVDNQYQRSYNNQYDDGDNGNVCCGILLGFFFTFLVCCGY